MKGCPIVFTHAPYPLEADDWLRAMEKQLNIASAMKLRKCCMLLINCKELHSNGRSTTNMDAQTMHHSSLEGIHYEFPIIPS